MSRAATKGHRVFRPVRTAALLVLLAAIGVGGCASSGSGGSSGSRNVLTHEQLLETQEPDVLLAVQRLRPRWLQPRGETVAGRQVVVFVDGSPRGDHTALRGMQIQVVAEIRYYTASEAGFRFGTTAGAGGVLEITTRR